MRAAGAGDTASGANDAELSALMASADAQKIDGHLCLGFEQMQQILNRGSALYRLDGRRLFCAVSLQEAETLRGIMHARQATPLLSDTPELSVGLRVLTLNGAHRRHSAMYLTAAI